MKFHYAGKYSGNPDDLPCLEHVSGAIPFKEAEDSKTLGRIASIIAIILFILAYAVVYMRSGSIYFGFPALILFIISMVPHEFIHALCFKEDVYMYQNLKHGMLFVVGPERMSKGRFILMSLMPSIVLAFIPFALFMINPELQQLGVFGAFGISAGAGDFYNVYHAVTQMPKGSWTYLHKFNSYWYMPENRQ